MSQPARRPACRSSSERSPDGSPTLSDPLGLRSGRPRHRRMGRPGPFYHYSDTWQLASTRYHRCHVLMVFLMQNTQNRDAKAIHLKLDELLRGVKGARTGLVRLEDLTEAELAELGKEFEALRRPLQTTGEEEGRGQGGRLSPRRQRSDSRVDFSSNLPSPKDRPSLWQLQISLRNDAVSPLI